MRILIFNYEYPPIGGGGGIVNEAVAEELARRHEIRVVTSRFGDLPHEESRNGVRIVRVPVLGRTDRAVASLRSMLTYPPSVWAYAARGLRPRSFDIVNAHFAVPTGPASLPVAAVAGLPHVLSLHGGDIYNPAYRYSPHKLPLVRPAVSWVLRRSDAVVAQSSDTRENAYRYYRYRGPIDLIPLGIRRPRVPPATRSELGLPPDAFLAVTVGRLLPRKAIDRLLHAIASQRCRSVHLVVIGEGPERERLESTARDLGLGARTRFLGRVSEKRKWQILESADVYLSSTRHEGFGLVFLEAMSAGLPVVCPDHGGQLDFLREGETGHLVPVDDDAALVAAIARLAARHDEAERMGRTCRRLSERYTAERCAAEYEALFERVVQGRPKASGP